MSSRLGNSAAGTNSRSATAGSLRPGDGSDLGGRTRTQINGSNTANRRGAGTSTGNRTGVANGRGAAGGLGGGSRTGNRGAANGGANGRVGGNANGRAGAAGGLGRGGVAGGSANARAGAAGGLGRGAVGGRNARGGPANGVSAATANATPGLGNGRPAPGYSHHDGNYNYGHYHNGFNYGFNNGFGRGRFWNVGFNFGFGYGLGWFGWGGWGYRSWCYPYFATGFWYPYTGFCHYPFFWSYNNFGRFRGFWGAANPGANTFFIDAPGYAADPYIDDISYLDPGIVNEPLAAPIAPVTTRRITLAPREVLRDQSFATGVDAGRDADTALATGRRLMAAGRPAEAAEAFRQSYVMRPESQTLRAMGIALVAVEDWHMASWAIQKGSLGSERAVLDFIEETTALLGGARLEASVSALERYLVTNANDEASNFLLGALYVASGRDYAGYVLLTRLSNADYQRETTDLYLNRARTNLAAR